MLAKQKLEKNYFKVRAQHLKYDALIQHLSLPKHYGPPLKRRKTKAADSRHAKASRRRTKKDKDLEDSNTSSDVPRLRRRDRAAARAQSAKRKHSSDINSKDDSEDEEATTAKDLAREQKERLKALLNAKTRDGLSARVRTAIEHYTLEE
ncbi:hypothetical protein HBI89_071570 [Parastagonospora nodorum]|nr:hypothetical protein HBI89_071570 [Parastagonospora nodorum]KAH5971256.1 hypothetical protein HBI86_044530 [Parastagonospora nodorum]